jgi:hypothetical protein
MVKESKFQAGLIKRLKSEFPGCVVLKNDEQYIQGFPDLTVLYQDKWAVLESKRFESASHRPNQDYYVNLLNGMSYSRFVYPENEEEVIDDLREVFEPGRKARTAKSK